MKHDEYTFEEFLEKFLDACMVQPSLPKEDIHDAWVAGQSATELAAHSDEIEMWEKK